MKGTGIYFIIFLLPVTIHSCIHTGETNRVTNNSSFVNDPAFIQHPGNPADSFIRDLMALNPVLFSAVLAKKDEWNVQVIYTQVNRGKKGKDPVQFRDHTFNLNDNHYFYPASTVKLPVAILALQKLNELNIPGLDRNTTMITGEEGDRQTELINDPSAADGRPTIAHYIKKILLVSDNDAFNRLYEFLGQEYINNTLHQMGYSDIQVIHRLSVSMSEEQNRHTNPVTFIDASGKVVYRKAAEKSKLSYAERHTKADSYRLGNGYMDGSKLVNEPFDFSKKNRLSLEDLHHILRSIIFPDAVRKEQRFNLSNEDYDFLRLYMSMRPGESVSPVYDRKEYWDNYVKMIFYGTKKTDPWPGIRIFNKTGTAYGFLTETCYIADFKANIEFMLSATIYCNSDGIFNDDKYDYNTVGYPFLENLGQLIYTYELKRQRKYTPDLSAFRFSYTR